MAQRKHGSEKLGPSRGRGVLFACNKIPTAWTAFSLTVIPVTTEVIGVLRELLLSRPQHPLTDIVISQEQLRYNQLTHSTFA